jgi:hypothetical protein
MVTDDEPSCSVFTLNAVHSAIPAANSDAEYRLARMAG